MKEGTRVVNFINASFLPKCVLICDCRSSSNCHSCCKLSNSMIYDYVVIARRRFHVTSMHRSGVLPGEEYGKFLSG